MFCEKCGTDNRNNATTCSRCGEKLPSASFCGGFADILSYEDKIPSASQSTAHTSVSASTAPEKHSSEIRKLTAHNAHLEKKIAELSQKLLIALGGTALALVLALACLFAKPSLTDIKNEIDSEISKIENDLPESKQEPVVKNEEKKHPPFIAIIQKQDKEIK